MTLRTLSRATLLAFAAALAGAMLAVQGAANAHAEPFPNLEQGRNYDREYLGLNDNGQPVFRWTSVPDRILHNGQYVPYVHTEQNGDHTVRTAQNTITFDPETCQASMQEGDSGDTGIFSDYYQPFRMADGTGNWIHVSQVTNAACNVDIVTDGDDIEIHATREAENVGRFTVKYIKEYGKPWKSQLEPTNLSALTNQHFGVRQFIEVPKVIQFGGQDRDLANFNGTTFNRTWLENNKANLIDFKNGISFDFDLGWQHLQSVTIHYYSGDTAVLQFDYFRNTQIILPGQTFVIDPTFGYSAGQRYKAQLAGGTGATCPSVGSSINTVGTTAIYKEASGSVGTPSCIAMANEFDISSIPSSSAVANVTLRVDYDSVTSSTNCNFGAYMGTQPSTIPNTAANALQLFFDIRNGTKYISNNADCKTVSTNNVYDLGAQADSDAETRISAGDGFFVVTFDFQNYTRSAAAQIVSSDNADIELEITYVVYVPEPPQNLSCTGEPFSASCTWDASVNATEVTAYYIQTSLDNSTFTNTTSTGNVTSYTIPNLTAGQTYYARVNATVNNLYNTTSSNHAQFTVDTVPDAPTLGLSRLNSTSINATSTAGASDGGDTVDWFGLQCEINRVGGWQSVVSNSTLPANRAYTISGLWSDGDVIICQWRDGNSVGWSAWSANATYPSKPDAVTTLTVISVFQTTAEISWDEPELYGLPLIGYQVNYTSPWGTPLTEITTTNTTETEYSIIGLQNNTQYSFRVTAITLAGSNATGNIVNIQTPTDFTPGDIDLDAENPLRFPIRFERTDINSTSSSLDVIYDDEIELDCTMYFEFAQDSQTFDDLNGTEYSDDEDSVTFYFNNPENEVITIDCYDSVDNSTSATYQMIQSAFPLLDVINNFRTGEYGTMGQFGPLDLITVFVVIISMIGFNRVNPAVGAIFCFIIIGATAYFGIIQWYSAVAGFIALVLMLAIASVRKDE